MVRLVLVLLVVAAAFLVVALARDSRARRDERIDHLRWTFLHGRPLAGSPRAVAFAEVVHPSGLRFRVPASWTIRIEGAGAVAAGVGRVVELTVERREPAGAQDGGVAGVLRAVAVEGERSVETLPSGNVLMKAVEAAREGKAALAVYSWWLAVARGEGIDVALFRIRVPVEAAADVIVQSDIAVLDGEVRGASFSG
jgi:hypothetical protein